MRDPDLVPAMAAAALGLTVDELAATLAEVAAGALESLGYMVRARDAELEAFDRIVADARSFYETALELGALT